METEFYNQAKWLELHKLADDFIATSDGKILAVLYRSPDERRREDYVRFVNMLKDWAAKQPSNIEEHKIKAEDSPS